MSTSNETDNRKRQISARIAALFASLSLVAGGIGVTAMQPGGPEQLHGWRVEDDKLVKVVMEIPNYKWTLEQLRDYRVRLDRMSGIIDSVIVLKEEYEAME